MSGLSVGAATPLWARPHRLVSLREVMERAYPERILQATWTVNFASTLPISELGAYLSYPDNKEALQNSLLLLNHHCSALDLKASRKTIDRIARVGRNLPLNLEYFRDLLRELEDRMRDELEGIFFFSLSSKEAEYYDNPGKGWELIVRRFPATLTDIEEASKCFAVSRYTASIFHSTHVVEIGLIELGTFIRIEDPHSGWSAVSNQLQKVVKKIITRWMSLRGLTGYFLNRSMLQLRRLRMHGATKSAMHRESCMFCRLILHRK